MSTRPLIISSQSAGVVPTVNFSSRSNVLSLPPPLPPDSVYTSCYCEENIYLLARTFAAEASARAARVDVWPWQIYIVFISNNRKTVALWSQNSRAPGGAVVWDYHVVLVLRPRPRDGPAIGGVNDLQDERWGAGARAPESSPRSVGAGFSHPFGQLEDDRAGPAWVYDFDTTLPVPCAWRDYIRGTFPYAFGRALGECVDARFISLFRIIPAKIYLDHFASDRSHMIVAASVAEACTQILDRPSVAGADEDGAMGTNETIVEPTNEPQYTPNLRKCPKDDQSGRRTDVNRTSRERPDKPPGTSV